jgi:SLT domain-containing protein
MRKSNKVQNSACPLLISEKQDRHASIEGKTCVTNWPWLCQHCIRSPSTAYADGPQYRRHDYGVGTEQNRTERILPYSAQRSTEVLTLTNSTKARKEDLAMQMCRMAYIPSLDSRQVTQKTTGRPPKECTSIQNPIPDIDRTVEHCAGVRRVKQKAV